MAFVHSYGIEELRNILSRQDFVNSLWEEMLTWQSGRKYDFVFDIPVM